MQTSQPFEELGENPNPEVPDTLLEKPTSLPFGGGSEFKKTEINNGVLFPKYACCGIAGTSCTIVIRKKQRGITGSLSLELPIVEFPAKAEKKPSLWDYTTWDSIWTKVETPERYVECDRPPLGPETKKRIAEIASKGWEELHLVWPAENNWFQVEGEGTSPNKFEKTEMLVVGEKGYDFRIAAKITDRTL